MQGKWSELTGPTHPDMSHCRPSVAGPRVAFFCSTRLRPFPCQGTYIALPLILQQINASVVQWSARFVVALKSKLPKRPWFKSRRWQTLMIFFALVYSVLMAPLSYSLSSTCLLSYVLTFTFVKKTTSLVDSEKFMPLSSVQGMLF
jgi:hypothetical protein